MKLSVLKPARHAGNVLVVTLVITVVIGATLASYLALVSTQSKLVARSQTWNGTMAVSEAGIEDAMQLLNKFVGTPNLAAWTTSYAVDGWTRPGGSNVYQLTRYMDAARTTFYSVAITQVGNSVVVRSTGNVPPPSSAAGSQPIKRTVEIRSSIDPLFNVCMAALGSIDLRGNGVASDSFDSSDPNYSTNGLYTPLRRKAGGDIVTNNAITNSVLSVGNANVAGKVTTGPNGSIAIGGNGTVGDLPWVDSNTPGIKPGWSGNDLNVVFKNAELPSPTWVIASGTNTGGPGVAPDGKTYAHVFNSPLDTMSSPGRYEISDSGDIYVGTNVSVQLNITVSTFRPDNIYVAGVAPAEAGRLHAYLNGAPGQTATLGTDNKTQSGRAENLIFFGLPNCTGISYKGNGDFTGAIYAPQADFHLAGGGSGIIDFVGSSVTRTVQMNGHYHFHYDENLRNVGPNNGYVASAWREL